ncbi:Hypothetical Protein FCC1311_024332 [Hondaea fermentalgiana]|uniref:Uncharacterized protein n=1 Tax=Hondaea fermentalgiana TaxID=2315210 RepID=A0A2R5G592_9STRA|nr:Hypothetical Protein FCC1311_024332 [Hondaea fermentalgiana]|eukprot:GBG26212.1 Hypothetical Protein FCC1311_024332 [Hondaea fermentalgiana]
MTQPPLPSGPPPSEDDVDHSPWRFVSRVSAKFGRVSGRLSQTGSNGQRPSLASLNRRLTHVHIPGTRREDNEYAFEDSGASSDEEDLETVEAGSLPSHATKANFMLAKVKGGVKGAGMATGHKVANQRIPQRIWLALIAVCWLWLTSYALAQYIVNSYIPVPDLDSVYDGNTLAYETSAAAREEYAADVERVADACEAAFIQANLTEIARSQSYRTYNENQITWLAGNITLIEAYYNVTQLALDALAEAGDIDLAEGSIYRSDSVADECKLISSIVAGEEAAINALNSANEYVSTTNAAAEDLAYQLQRKREYDTEYYANKTQDLVDLQEQLVASVHNMTASFLNIGSYLDEFKECVVADGSCDSSSSTVFDKLSSMYTSGLQFFSNIKTAASNYKEAALEQMNEYNKTIISINDNLASIQQHFGTISGIPSTSDTSTPNFDVDSYSMDSVSTPDDVTSSFNESYSSLTSNVSSSGEVFEADANATRENSVGWEEGWDDDYSPADNETETNATVAALASSGDTFISNFSSTLSSITEDVDEDYGDVIDSVVSTTVNATVSASDVLVELTDHSSWDFYAYNSSIISQISDGFQDMSDLILTFDTVFRVMYTLIIINKYWSLTGLATPPGDARIKAESGAGWGPKKTLVQKLAAIFLNPIFITLVSVTGVSLVLYMFWWAYSPLYFAYVESCVQNDWRDIEAGTVNGTMLYRNAYSVVFQYACATGDTLAQTRTDDINVGRDFFCSKQTYDDTIYYNDQVELFDDLYERFESTVNQNAALVECLNLANIDAQENTDFEVRVALANFAYEFGPLTQSAIYDCDNVQGCDAIRGKDEVQSQAEGPDEDLLQSVTFDATCNSEYWVHANLFSGFMVISVYIILNISRITGSRALVRVLWRQVVVRNFSVFISVTDRGEIIYPERVTEKGDTMQEAIRLAVKKAIKSWERWGWFFLFMAIFMNAPWIYALWYISSTIEYSSS